MKHLTRIALISCLALFAASCGGSSGGDTDNSSAEGVRIVDVGAGASLLEDAPADLVVLDVRTSEEFAEGHLEGATMIDFYAPDFADRIAELDPDVPYLLYCRSGNRSGQAATLMRDLGFSDVADVDGGILAWTQAGNDVVIP